MPAPAEIYLDHAASTPLRPVARDAWLAAAEQHHANPTGSHHAARQARRALDRAREQVAAALGAAPGEIVFTSGGSEADNMAVRGALGAREAPLAVTTEAEHHAVHDPVERAGGVFVGVDSRGVVDLEALSAVLSAHADAVGVVSVIAVNNETGSITPLRDVAATVRAFAPGAWLHTDAVQGSQLGRRGRRDRRLRSDFGDRPQGRLTVGTGVLVVRDGIELDPLIIGGGQERGRRAGTPDVAGAVSFAAALTEATEQREDGVARLEPLRDALIDGLADRLGDRVVVSAARTSGDRSHIAAGIANVCIAGVQSEALLFLMDAEGVRASAASSCSSGAQDPSHVLAAMGVPRDLALGSLRPVARSHHCRLRRGARR